MHVSVSVSVCMFVYSDGARVCSPPCVRDKQHDMPRPNSRASCNDQTTVPIGKGTRGTPAPHDTFPPAAIPPNPSVAHHLGLPGVTSPNPKPTVTTRDHLINTYTSVKFPQSTPLFPNAKSHLT